MSYDDEREDYERRTKDITISQEVAMRMSVAEIEAKIDYLIRHGKQCEADAERIRREGLDAKTYERTMACDKKADFLLYRVGVVNGSLGNLKRALKNK